MDFDNFFTEYDGFIRARSRGLAQELLKLMNYVKKQLSSYGSIVADYLP